MKISFAAIVAVITGLVVFTGIVFAIPGSVNLNTTLIGWAVILAGIATLVGILNLISVHWRKIFRKHDRDLYSPFLLLAFAVTVILGIWLTPADKNFQHVVTSIQIPVETSLLALLSVTLVMAAVRLFRLRKGLMVWSFFVSAVLFIIFGSGLLVIFPAGSPFLDWVGYLNLVPLAGARGILLGVALGSLMTGLRIILGSDRPYSG